MQKCVNKKVKIVFTISGITTVFIWTGVFYVMFKKRARVFYRVFDPIKHVLRVFLNGFKNILGKTCVKRVHNNYAFVNVRN